MTDGPLQDQGHDSTDDSPAPSGAPLTSAHLEGRFVVLHVPTPEDYGEIHQLWNHPEVMLKWRDRGGTRPLEAIGQTLWTGSEIVFAVRNGATGALVGTGMCYGLDTYNRHAKFAMVATPEVWSRPHGIEASWLFIDHCFRSLDLRKIYMDVPAFNMKQFSGGLGKYFVEEGRLVGHEYLDGHYWDSVILAIHRSNWMQEAGPALSEWLASSAR